MSIYPEQAVKTKAGLPTPTDIGFAPGPRVIVIFVGTIIPIEEARRAGLSNRRLAFAAHDINMPGLNIGARRRTRRDIQ